MKAPRPRIISLAMGTMFAVALATAPLSAKQPQTPAAATTYYSQVEQITKGATTADRGLAITQRLDQLGVKWTKEPFEVKDMKGENIVADFGGTGNKPLLVGAHYDRVDVGVGAVDNASSSAAMLDLVQRLKKGPALQNPVRVVFFDLEEKGLLGAKAYVEKHKDSLPSRMINLDVFGYGDTLWVMAPKGPSPMADAMKAATGKLKIESIVGETYPPSDHLVFIKAGVPTISLSLLGNQEIRSIVTMFESRQKPDPMPKVFSVIHTAGDDLSQIDANAVVRALPAVEDAIREIDKQ